MVLANNIVQIITHAFPTTIDTMNRESALQDGPKPILITSTKGSSEFTDYIKYFLIGGEKKEDKLDYDQVIIVRNEEAKEKLNVDMKKMAGMILTV